MCSAAAGRIPRPESVCAKILGGGLMRAYFLGDGDDFEAVEQAGALQLEALILGAAVGDDGETGVAASRFEGGEGVGE